LEGILRGGSFTEGAVISDSLRIDLPNFLTTCHVADSINVAQAVRLFDRDRWISPIEAFFTPDFLRSYYRSKPAALQELHQVVSADDHAKIDLTASPISPFCRSQEDAASPARRSDISTETVQKDPWGEEKKARDSVDEAVLNRVRRLEECVKKLMSKETSQTDLQKGLLPGVQPRASHSSKLLEAKDHHEMEDKSRGCLEADEIVPHVLQMPQEQLKDQERKMVAAHELLLGVASYHADFLKQVIESVQSLRIKINQMEIMTQEDELVRSERKDKAAAHNSLPSGSTPLMSNSTCASPHESPDELRGSEIRYGTRLQKAEINIISTMQRVENLDRKLDSLRTRMPRSRSKEISNIKEACGEARVPDDVRAANEQQAGVPKELTEQSTESALQALSNFFQSIQVENTAQQP